MTIKIDPLKLRMDDLLGVADVIEELVRVMDALDALEEEDPGLSCADVRIGAGPALLLPVDDIRRLLAGQKDRLVDELADRGILIAPEGDEEKDDRDDEPVRTH